MNTSLRRGVAVAVSAGLTVASSTVAVAQTSPSGPPGPTAGVVEQCLVEVEPQALHGASAAEGSPLPAPGRAESARAKASVLSAVRSGLLTVNSNVTPRSVREASVERIEEGLVVVVALPDLGSMSNLTVLLADDGAVLTTAESHFRALSDTAGHATVWRDGDLVLDRVVDESEVFETASADGGVTVLDHNLGFFGALNQCLSSAGLASWLVAAALIACGATGPVGMVVCLVGAGIGAGTASYCVRWAITHG